MISSPLRCFRPLLLKKCVDLYISKYYEHVATAPPGALYVVGSKPL